MPGLKSWWVLKVAKEFNISKASGTCSACHKLMRPGDEVVATVKEVNEEFVREDFCADCWKPQPDQEEALAGVWRTKAPQPQEKKRLLVDDAILANLFERLGGTDQPAKINFRYVLALVLWRKKLLVYDRMERRPDGGEVWKMHFKGSDQVQEVIDPKMDDLKIAEVSGQLSQIMEGEV